MSEPLSHNSGRLGTIRRYVPWSIAIAIIGFVIVYYLPYVLPSYQLVLLTSAASAGVAILGLNILFGYTGQISLGHAAFFGVGAYGCGILVSRYHWSYPPAMLASMVIAFLAGLIVSIPASKLRGLYLALVTIAVGAVFPGLLRRFTWLTNGDNGIFSLQWQAPSWTGLYGLQGQQIWGFWVSGGCLVVVCLLAHNLISSRVGRSLIAVRDHEIAAAAAGVRVIRVKALSFAVAGALGALGGGLATASVGVIQPAQFGLGQSIELLVAMVIGGAATLRGSILGGLVYVYVPYYTSQVFSGPISGVLFGAAIILAVFIAPNGIDGLLTRGVTYLHSRWRSSRRGEPPPPADGSDRQASDTTATRLEPQPTPSST